jgi:hypothetical protein
MFKQLKEGNISSESPDTNKSLRQQIVKFAASISSQLLATGAAFASASENDFNNFNNFNNFNFNEIMTKALAELVTAELIYYYQLSEVGCCIAVAYSDEQSPVSPMAEPQTPRPVPESEDDVGNDDDETDDDDDAFQGPLQRARSMSFACPRATSPSQVKLGSGSTNQLAANLLIASGRVRQQIEELARFLGISVDVLDAASFQSGSESESEKTRRQQKLVYGVFTFMGGKSGASQNGKTCYTRRIHAVEGLCEISKMTWALMNLCEMTNTFRFAIDTPLFKTVTIDPIESVFGNNGWRAAHTTVHTTPVVADNDAAAAAAAANNGDDNNYYDCDDTPSHW